MEGVRSSRIPPEGCGRGKAITRSTIRERARANPGFPLGANVVAIAFYRCGGWKFVKEPRGEVVPGEPRPISQTPRGTPAQNRACVPIKCRCGSELAMVDHLSERRQ